MTIDSRVASKARTSLSRGLRSSDALPSRVTFPVGGLLAILPPQRREILLVVVLLHHEVLEPLILRLELSDAALERSDLIAHLPGRLLERLLALLLLDAEARAGSRVAPALVLLGRDARRVLKARAVGAVAVEEGIGGRALLPVLRAGEARWRRGAGVARGWVELLVLLLAVRVLVLLREGAEVRKREVAYSSHHIVSKNERLRFTAIVEEDGGATRREALWLGENVGFLETAFSGGRKGRGNSRTGERLLIIRDVCVVIRGGGCLMVYHVKRRAKADRR